MEQWNFTKDLHAPRGSAESPILTGIDLFCQINVIGLIQGHTVLRRWNSRSAWDIRSLSRSARDVQVKACEAGSIEGRPVPDLGSLEIAEPFRRQSQ